MGDRTSTRSWWSAGEDLVREVYTWNNGSYSLALDVRARFGRLCSADLPPLGAFYNPLTGRGFAGRIYMNGEETGAEGRGFGHVVSGAQNGRSFELPYLGRFSWENSVAHPYAGDSTIVMGLDDSTPGQVYVYVGAKQSSGNPVERAGLVGGRLYGIKVTNGGPNYAGGAVTLENAGAVMNGAFTLVDVTAPPADLLSGAQLQVRSVAAGVTEFARPEDGHWDTQLNRVFYFVTTGASIGGATQTARLYKLTFDDIRNPTAGGRFDLVVDAASIMGTDGATARSFDNITVDAEGRVLVQEDPGGTSYIAKVWQIDPTGQTAPLQIFESDRARFISGTPTFLTTDEENWGSSRSPVWCARPRGSIRRAAITSASRRPTTGTGRCSSKAASSTSWRPRRRRAPDDRPRTAAFARGAAVDDNSRRGRQRR